ncbi:hypothetical protein G4B88_017848 [Cannabis sativa]|uniref:RNA polymerase Rpb1 domain-containing protein n=1 Tax=Cannabis sativa TaxID=3483 RepID=A0A7J6GQ82_CANSA|nr:hypothetical protein G4B88_017848 [Cannabis sativa]
MLRAHFSSSLYWAYKKPLTLSSETAESAIDAQERRGKGKDGKYYDNRAVIRSTFASKKVLEEYRLTREAFEWVTGEIESHFLQSLVAPGEMIGSRPSGISSPSLQSHRHRRQHCIKVLVVRPLAPTKVDSSVVLSLHKGKQRESDIGRGRRGGLGFSSLEGTNLESVGGGRSRSTVILVYTPASHRFLIAQNSVGVFNLSVGLALTLPISLEPKTEETTQSNITNSMALPQCKLHIGVAYEKAKDNYKEAQFQCQANPNNNHFLELEQVEKSLM